MMRNPESTVEVSAEEKPPAHAELRALVRALGGSFIRVDAGDRIVDFSEDAATDALTTGNLAGKRVPEALRAEVAEKFQAAMAQVRAHPAVVAIECCPCAGNGQHQYEARLVPLPRNEVLVLLRDLGEAQRTEEALQQSEEKYRRLIETTDTGYVILDEQGRVLDANREYARLTGHQRREEILGRSVLDWTAPHDRERNAAAFRRCVEQGFVRNLEMDYLTRAGEVIPIEVNASVLRASGTLQVLALCRDISGRKQAEEALRESQRRLSLFFNQSLDGFYFSAFDEPISWNDETDKEKALDCVSTHQRITAVNDAMLAQYGASRESLVGRRVGAFFQHDPREGRGFQRKLFDEGRLRAETCERKDDGTPIWIEGDYMCIRDAQGRITGTFGIQRDITQRKQAEVALRQSEELLRKSQSVARLGSYDFDAQTGNWISSAALDELFGIGAGHPKNVDGWVALVHPEQKAEMGAYLLEHVIQARHRFDKEYRILRHNDGAERWVHGLGELEFDDQGRTIKMIGTIQDITERKRAEEALRESMRRLQTVVTGAPIVLYSFDRNGVFTLSEGKGLTGLGIQPGEIVGKTVFEIYGDQPTAIAALRRALAGETFALELSFPAGGTFEASHIALHDAAGAYDGTIGVLVDITARRQAEDRVRQSEERLRLALAAANQGLYDLNVQTGETVVSPEYALMLGYDSAAFRETNEQWRLRLHPDDQERVYRTYTEYVAGRRPEYRVEFRQRTQAGQWKWILSLGKVVAHDAEGRPLRMLGTHTDITDRKRMEEALSLTIERLSLAMEAANDGLWDLHLPTDSAYFSPRYFAMLGYTPDELPVRMDTVLSLIHEDDRDWVERKFKHYLRHPEGAYEIEFRMRRSSGAYAWIMSRGKVVQFDERGRALRFIGIHSDITERKEAEARVAQAMDELERKVRERTEALSQANEALRGNEARVRLILDNVQAGIVLVDQETRAILEANPTALALSGYRREEVVGSICHRLLCPAEQGQCPILDRGGRVDNSERLLLRADGTTLPILKTVVPVNLGGRALLLESFVDLSERKRAQQELLRAKEDAEAGSRAKSEFLAMMSHEIRTPLSGVIGVLRLLGQDTLTAKQDRYLDMASTSAETLLKVINDILDFSKVEAGKLDLDCVTFDLHGSVQSIAGMFQARATAKGLVIVVAVDAAVPRWVRGDSLRVSQVLINLVGNALKFTEAGQVAVQVSARPEANDRTLVRCTVTDTGIGVPAERQSHLFEPFYQVDSSARRRYGGTGLGLGICRQLVRLMGGAMGFQSEVGSGSTFWFELPLDLAPANTWPAPTPPVSASQQPPARTSDASRPPARVLLAEDNEINQELAREMIQAAGCTCECVGNGKSAVSAVFAGGYDLVFMDCMMPEMDGYEAAQAIRADEARQPAGGPARHVPIIALTANAMKGDRERCLAAGMDDYMCKPLEPEAVVGMVDKWLAASRGVT